jgi:hypothetical protein
MYPLAVDVRLLWLGASENATIANQVFSYVWHQLSRGQCWI